jgi:hypothetical protein
LFPTSRVVIKKETAIMHRQHLLLLFALCLPSWLLPLSLGSAETPKKQRFLEDDGKNAPPSHEEMEPPTAPPSAPLQKKIFPPPSGQAPEKSLEWHAAQQAAAPRPPPLRHYADIHAAYRFSEGKHLHAFSLGADLRLFSPFVFSVVADFGWMNFSLVTRAGLGLRFLSFRDPLTGQGVEAVFNLLVGYRYLLMTAFHVNDAYHGFNLFIANTFYFWLHRSFGVFVQLGFGMDFWFHRSNAFSEATQTIEMRAAAGICF